MLPDGRAADGSGRSLVTHGPKQGDRRYPGPQSVTGQVCPRCGLLRSRPCGVADNSGDLSSHQLPTRHLRITRRLPGTAWRQFGPGTVSSDRLQPRGSERTRRHQTFHGRDGELLEIPDRLADRLRLLGWATCHGPSAREPFPDGPASGRCLRHRAPRAPCRPPQGHRQRTRWLADRGVSVPGHPSAESIRSTGYGGLSVSR